MVRSQSNNKRTQTTYKLKYNSKNNKTVIRAEKVAGKFTTIPHRIIHDKRLSTDARLLLISILSDADSFDFSRTGLMNRLELTEYKLDNSLKELIKFGYIKKAKTYGQYFHYTVSEYGNLNNKDEDLSKDESASKETPLVQDASDNYLDSEQFTKDWKGIKQYCDERKKYLNIELLEEKVPAIETRDDVFELRRLQDKEINKNKLKHYKELEDFANGKASFNGFRTKVLNELKRLIFDEHEKPSENDVMRIKGKISHQQYKDRTKKYGFDLETQMIDDYENPMD